MNETKQIPAEEAERRIVALETQAMRDKRHFCEFQLDVGRWISCSIDGAGFVYEVETNFAKAELSRDDLLLTFKRYIEAQHNTALYAERARQ